MAEFDDLQAFVEVVSQGGFAVAARRLGVAKSIVSRRIGRLEADLGVRLFNRTSRGVVPTDAGQEYYLRASRILSDLAEARGAVVDSSGQISGRLRLCLPLSFGLRYIAPLLSEWAQANPQLHIDAAYSDGRVDLLAGRFDAAIRIGVLKDSTLIARRITSIGLALAASPAYLERAGAPRSLADLIDHECLIYSGASDRGLWQFRSGKKRLTVTPTGRFHADSGEALLQAALAGLGIALLPTFLLHEAIRDGRLVRLFADHDLGEEALFVVRPPGAHVPARVRGLIQMLLAAFEGEPAWRLD